MKIAVNKNQIALVRFYKRIESTPAKIRIEFSGEEPEEYYYGSDEEALEVYEKLKQQLGLMEIEL